MAELADALDLGSSGLAPCGFESRPSHHFLLVDNPLALKAIGRVNFNTYLCRVELMALLTVCCTLKIAML